MTPRLSPAFTVSPALAVMVPPAANKPARSVDVRLIVDVPPNVIEEPVFASTPPPNPALAAVIDRLPAVVMTPPPVAQRPKEPAPTLRVVAPLSAIRAPNAPA